MSAVILKDCGYKLFRNCLSSYFLKSCVAESCSMAENNENPVSFSLSYEGQSKSCLFGFRNTATVRLNDLTSYQF